MFLVHLCLSQKPNLDNLTFILYCFAVNDSKMKLKFKTSVHVFSVPFTSQFATLKTRRELEPKCVAQLFLGWLLGTRRTAIGSYWPIGHFRVLKTPFQNEARCKTFLVKMSLICIRIKESFPYQRLCT